METLTLEFTAHDRCDACGAQAKSAAIQPGSFTPSLMFCGHHTTKHAERLSDQGWTVLYAPAST